MAQVLQGVNAVSTKVQRTARPFTGVAPSALKAKVEAVDLDRPLPDTAAALDELDDLYLKDAIYFHDARYAAHLNCPVVIPALVGEAVLSAVNSSMDTWDQSAGATMIERRLIDWTAERIGFSAEADGVFTSGGSQSNFQALLIARNQAVAKLRATSPEVRLPHLLDRLRIFTSADSHFSIQKSASMLGLGFDAVIAVPTSEDHRMDPLRWRQPWRKRTMPGWCPWRLWPLRGPPTSVRWILLPRCRRSSGPTIRGSTSTLPTAEDCSSRAGTGIFLTASTWPTR